MKVAKINPENPDPSVLKKAGKLLLHDGIIIHPTETVYGLAGLAFSEPVLRRINRLKEREETQPLSIMVNSIEMILEIIGDQQRWLENFLSEIFPAPVTVLLPRLRKMSIDFWNHFPELGFRYPAHPLSIRLVEFAEQPLVTTSANFSGEPPPTTVSEIVERLKQKVSLVLDGGETLEKVPSTIFRINPERRTIAFVRDGAVTRERIQNSFAKS